MKRRAKGRFTKHQSIRNPNLIDGMVRYDESKEEQQWVTIDEIIVPTEFDKEQLLKAIKYIHYLRNIDTDYMAVNTLVHIYENPDLIKVK